MSKIVPSLITRKKHLFIWYTAKFEFTRLALRTAERYLKDWTDSGLLKKVGSGPSTKYELNDK